MNFFVIRNNANATSGPVHAAVHADGDSVELSVRRAAHEVPADGVSVDAWLEGCRNERQRGAGDAEQPFEDAAAKPERQRQRLSARRDPQRLRADKTERTSAERRCRHALVLLPRAADIQKTHRGREERAQSTYLSDIAEDHHERHDGAEEESLADEDIVVAGRETGMEAILRTNINHRNTFNSSRKFPTFRTP